MNSQRFSCLRLPSAGIKGVRHHRLARFLCFVLVFCLFVCLFLRHCLELAILCLASVGMTGMPCHTRILIIWKVLHGESSCHSEGDGLKSAGGGSVSSGILMHKRSVEEPTSVVPVVLYPRWLLEDSNVGGVTGSQTCWHSGSVPQGPHESPLC